MKHFDAAGIAVYALSYDEADALRDFRDAHGIGQLAMPAYAACASAPTNLTLHEALDINVPIACGDAPVFPGDVLVGDRDGVMVIPAHLAEEIAEECTTMETFEDFVLEEVEGGAPIIGLYPCTKDENQKKFEAWRDKNGR